MFTGLVEAVGKVCRIESRGQNRIFLIEADFSSELKPGESVAVQGCCLTVVNVLDRVFQVEAVSATLKATTLSDLRVGALVNLERALQVGERLGGHIVLGHIDEVGIIRRIGRRGGEVVMVIGVSKKNTIWLVDKGSVAIDGVSLTVAKTGWGEFSVNLIPYTLKKTNLGTRKSGERVNIEYDILVKAAQRVSGRHPAVPFGAE